MKVHLKIDQTLFFGKTSGEHKSWYVTIIKEKIFQRIMLQKWGKSLKDLRNILLLQ